MSPRFAEPEKSPKYADDLFLQLSVGSTENTPASVYLYTLWKRQFSVFVAYRQTRFFASRRYLSFLYTHLSTLRSRNWQIDDANRHDFLRIVENGENKNKRFVSRVRLKTSPASRIRQFIRRIPTFIRSGYNRDRPAHSFSPPKNKRIIVSRGKTRTKSVVGSRDAISLSLSRRFPPAG